MIEIKKKGRAHLFGPGWTLRARVSATQHFLIQGKAVLSKTMVSTRLLFVFPLVLFNCREAKILRGSSLRTVSHSDRLD
jgi:hypothetical protein